MKRSQQRIAHAREAGEGPEHAARRAEIREKAREVFVRHGYRKTTIEDVGRACGLGKAALYHYFSGKEELFAEVVRSEGEKVLARIRAAVAATEDPRAQLVAMVKTSFEATREIVDALVDDQSALALPGTLPLAAAAAHRRFIDEEVKILSKILAAGERKGVFRKVGARSVPLVIILGLRSVQLPSLAVRDPRKLEGAVDTLVDLFLGGICR